VTIVMTAESAGASSERIMLQGGGGHVWARDCETAWRAADSLVDQVPQWFIAVVDVCACMHGLRVNVRACCECNDKTLRLVIVALVVTTGRASCAA
jgi:hypothetical protein